MICSGFLQDSVTAVSASYSRSGIKVHSTTTYSYFLMMPSASNSTMLLVDRDAAHEHDQQNQAHKRVRIEIGWALTAELELLLQALLLDLGQLLLRHLHREVHRRVRVV